MLHPLQPFAIRGVIWYQGESVIGGNAGDVIWGDYHPSGAPSFQSVVIHAGDGKNFIYANDTVNQVWTGTNPQTVVHAIGGGGVVHCENTHIAIDTNHKARRHYKLVGCGPVSRRRRSGGRGRPLACEGGVEETLSRWWLPL